MFLIYILRYSYDSYNNFKSFEVDLELCMKNAEFSQGLIFFHVEVTSLEDPAYLTM
jgi:hypothetical protein